MKKYIGKVEIHSDDPQFIEVEAGDMKDAVRKIVLAAYGDEFGEDATSIEELAKKFAYCLSDEASPEDEIKYSWDYFKDEPFFSHFSGITVHEVAAEEIFDTEDFEKKILLGVKKQNDDKARKSRLRQYKKLKKEFEEQGGQK